MGEVTKRIISGVIMAGLLLGDLWMGAGWFTALLAVGAVILWREYARMIWNGWRSSRARLLWVIFGLAYFGAAIFGLWRARNTEDGFFIAMLLFGVVWATDIGAFVSGRAIGGPKIAPSISPSKTWAGFAGGSGAVMLVVIGALWWKLDLPPTRWNIYLPACLVACVLIAAVAQAGDFFESWLKRRAGMKDSGALIPGHGGLFDRVDGLLPVAIVFGIVVAWTLPG